MIFILPVSKKYHETATASRKESVPKIFTTRRMQRKRLQKTELSLVTLIAGTRKLYPPQSRVPKYFKSCFVLLRTAFVQQHILHRDLLGRCKLCARCWRHLCKKKKNPQTQRQVCRITCRRKTPQNVQLFFKPISFTISSIVHPYNSL